MKFHPQVILSLEVMINAQALQKKEKSPWDGGNSG